MKLLPADFPLRPRLVVSRRRNCKADDDPSSPALLIRVASQAILKLSAWCVVFNFLFGDHAIVIASRHESNASAFTSTGSTLQVQASYRHWRETAKQLK
jgi:hypothetical protein